MKFKGNGYMFRLGEYEILIQKREKPKQPVRLEKVIVEETEYEKLKNTLNTKLNIILFILLLILFTILCYMLVPQTYGYIWY